MRTIYAAIEYTARWTERVPVEVPDDADEVDAEALLEALDKLQPSRVPDDDEFDRELVDWADDTTWPTGKPDAPPPGAWVEVPGFGRWVHDGSHAVREGVAMPPRFVGIEWRTDGHTEAAAGLLALLTAPQASAPPDGLGLPSESDQTSRWSRSRADRTLRLLDGRRVVFVAGEAPRFAAAIGLDEQGEPATIASLWRQDRG
jgi:hypothetical protein